MKTKADNRDQQKPLKRRDFLEKVKITWKWCAGATFAFIDEIS